MLFIIVFSSLLFFLLLFLLGPILGIYGVLVIFFFQFICNMFLLYEYALMLIDSSYVLVQTNLYFFDIGYSYLTWSLFVDHITLVMLFVVLMISFLVHIYSFFYMRYDPHLIRFLSLLSLFTFCMLLLVTSFNFIQMFFGWEGVGICSYFLINFWFTRIQANKASIKAMLVNRIGDSSFLIFMSIYYYLFKTFEFYPIYSVLETYKYVYFNFFFMDLHLCSLLVFFLLIAVIGKSAQLGLHTWLPDAMEGPTPVSALIHAATMVTAGVFLVIRLSYIFELSCNTWLLVVFGGLTALFGSLVAIVQFDIKKVIAFSTTSQLGYMVLACGLSRYDLALFHLFNHAFFKALLFLAAGVIIHSLMDEQDMRKMGGLSKMMPFTYFSVLLASYALLGLPFLSGFYSKDLILELSFSYYDFYTYFFFFFILFAAFFTAFYSSRLLIMVFFDKPKGFFKVYINVHEGDFVLLIIFFILALLSLFSGFLFRDFFVGFGAFNFSLILLKDYSYNFLFDYEFIFFFLKLLPLFFSLVGLFIGYLNVDYFRYYNFKFRKIYSFLSNKWFIDFNYNSNFVLSVFNFSYFITFKKLDKNLFEVFGVRGVYYFFFKLSYLYTSIYSNYLYVYIFIYILFLIVFLVYLFIFDFFIIHFILVIIYFFSLFFYKNNQYGGGESRKCG